MTPRILDRLKLLANGVVVGGLVVAYAIFGHDNTDPKWVGLGIDTLVVFWYLATYNRARWPQPKFWLLLTVLLIAHSAAFIFVLVRVSRVPLIWFVLAAMAEGILFDSVLEKCCRSQHT
jgi:hypothetical protein